MRPVQVYSTGDAKGVLYASLALNRFNTTKDVYFILSVCINICTANWQQDAETTEPYKDERIVVF